MTFSKFLAQLLFICAIVFVVSCEQDMTDGLVEDQTSLELRGPDQEAICNTLVDLGLIDSLACADLSLRGGLGKICRELVDEGVFGTTQECLDILDTDDGEEEEEEDDDAAEVCDRLVELGVIDSIACDSLDFSDESAICANLVALGVFETEEECTGILFPGEDDDNSEEICNTLVELGVIDSIACDNLDFSDESAICATLVEAGIFESEEACTATLFPDDEEEEEEGGNNTVCDILLELGLISDIAECEGLDLGNGPVKVCRGLVEAGIFDSVQECRNTLF